MEQSNDKKLILIIIAVSVFSILLNPVKFWTMLEEKFHIDSPEITQFITKNFDKPQDEKIFWQQVKGTYSTAPALASTASMEKLIAEKAASRGFEFDPASGEFVDPETLKKLKPPFTFMIIGSSSMLEGLGPRIEKDLRTIPQMTVIRRGKYSSGLTNTRFYNWNIESTKLIASYAPDAIITQFGGNDGQAITTSSGRRINYGAAGWNEAYENNVDQFMKTISQVKVVYWIELPIAGNADFTEKFIRMNAVQRKVASRYPNIVYVETWQRFAPNGRYVPVLADDSGKRAAVKASDGVHLSDHGAKIVSSILLGYISKDIASE